MSRFRPGVDECRRRGVFVRAPCGVASTAGRERWLAGIKSASYQPIVRITSRLARDHHRHTKVDDLFAQRDSDPLGLLSLPDLGI